MYLRAKVRKKDGKEHRYFSVVESQRVGDGRVVQRHVLYLGEINSSQELAWRRSIEVLDESSQEHRTLALFPEDHCEGVLADESVVRLRLSQMRLERPRQWGGCWLALELWRELELEFWAQRLTPSRKGTRWSEVLLILVVYRLLSPGSEWHPPVACPSYPSVRRYLKAHGLTRKRPERRGIDQILNASPVPTEREIRSYEVAYVLQLLHLDFHEGSRKILTRTGERITPLLVAFIDDHSRFMAHAQWYTNSCDASHDRRYHCRWQARRER
jgi:hypothetical protein